MTTTPTFDLGLLLDMLTYCRPAHSQTTDVFCSRFIAVLPGARLDAFGNWHVTIGDSPILWSAHTDTVHSMKGPARQTVHYDAQADTVQLSKRSRKHSRCLGADDTAGVFLLVSLIRAQVPGHYIFHRAEEIGGIGSSDLAEHAPELLNGSTFAIALDRKGYSHVITHQWSRCCSLAFADSLAQQLNRNGLRYQADSTGVFTDTANYTAIVPECTNLSVGYHKAHTEDEWLDVGHLRELLPALAGIDATALVSERLTTDEDFEIDTRWTVIGSAADTRDNGSPIWGGKVLPFNTSNTEADAECYVCGYLFQSALSTADNQMDYCCKECEHYDLYVQVREQHPNPDAVYLDENYAAIQEALGRSIDALPPGRNRKVH